jgi:antitoxin component YwqK of YwqJK toxin-antitoxin module
MADLDIAEIFYDSGAIRFRYSRYLSEDGLSWVRHGLFRAYHECGALASEGQYCNGTEQGVWRDFHSNGRLAAEGVYESGKEVGIWRFWDDQGTLLEESKTGGGEDGSENGTGRNGHVAD